jgi:hypothetical protein
VAKTIKLSDEDQVTAHIQKLDAELVTVVQAIREIILSINPEIGQQIKWNNPSFYYTGAMKPFDPKEYKRDIVVLNLHKGRIMLVFPTGARVENHNGLLEGTYTDGRRTAVFKDLDDVRSKEKLLRNAIREWLGTVEKE